MGPSYSAGSLLTDTVGVKDVCADLQLTVGGRSMSVGTTSFLLQENGLPFGKRKEGQEGGGCKDGDRQ